MDQMQTNTACITNEEEETNSAKKPMNQEHHIINMMAKNFCRECQNAQIPVFVAYYVPGKGYRYRAVFPEELESDSVKSEYDKFMKFLQVCIDFNKEDYLPKIQDV